MEPKRVLIGGVTGNTGGLELYIMNIYRNIDRTKLQFDFLNFEKVPLAFNDEIVKLGGNVYSIPLRKKNPIKHRQVLSEVLKSNKYVGFYYQCNRKLRTMDLYKLAKKYGVEKRVIHSHNMSDRERSKFIMFREKLAEMSYDRYATDYFACSEQAGKWMFHDRKFTVMNNSIDTDVFKYNETIRNNIRKEFNINDDTVVLGTVGRIEYQKNPEFIVETFNAYHKINPNSIFIHIGDGTERTKIENMISNYGLTDSYHLMGVKNNVADYLNAMDIFLFPSRYEGFGIVLIEAQSVGLRIIADTSVPRESKLTDLILYKETEDPQSWADEIEKMAHSLNRVDMSEVVNEKGFGVKSLAKKIQDYFC